MTEAMRLAAAAAAGMVVSPSRAFSRPLDPGSNALRFSPEAPRATDCSTEASSTPSISLKRSRRRQALDLASDVAHDPFACHCSFNVKGRHS